MSDKKGRTGLHIAANNGHYDMVALLMGQGVELGAKDRVSVNGAGSGTRSQGQGEC